MDIFVIRDVFYFFCILFAANCLFSHPAFNVWVDQHIERLFEFEKRVEPLEDNDDVKEDKEVTEKKVVVEKYEDKYIARFREMHAQTASDFTRRVQIRQSELEAKEKEKEEEEVKDNHEKRMAALWEEALALVTKEQHQHLVDCMILEMTPLGNVVMRYDVDRNTFLYYSDNTIPYRYLETVGRKFVLTFHCPQIYVDMEEEIKRAEEKKKVEKEKGKEKEKEKDKDKDKDSTETTKQRPSVFAKFKSYNREAGAGRVQSVAPPKNNISNVNVSSEKKAEDMILKERANRYTYEGKMVNFSFLKKVKKREVVKKYAMTFAEFKKMQLETEKK